MKKIGFILLACLIIAGCKKKDETPVGDLSLVGTWDYIAGYSRTDSIWAWNYVLPADSHYIQFLNATEVETNNYTPRCRGTYQLATDSLMTINYPCLPDLTWKLYLIEKTDTSLLFLDRGQYQGFKYKFKKR